MVRPIAMDSSAPIFCMVRVLLRAMVRMLLRAMVCMLPCAMVYLLGLLYCLLVVAERVGIHGCYLLAYEVGVRIVYVDHLDA